MAHVQNVWLTLVAISMFPLYGFSVKFFYARLRNITRVRSQALAEVQGHLHERVQGMSVIRSFALAEGIGLYFKISKDVSMWTAGGLIGTTWVQLQIVIPIILIGLLLAILFSKQLTILSLSEEVATGLGQKTFAVKLVLPNL